MAGRMACIVFFLLYIHLCQAQNDALDGGSTGDNGHQFVDGTANTEKISLGLNCVKEGNKLTLDFRVNQGDLGFKYESSATLNADKLILYEKCYFINAETYGNDKTIDKATPHANCGNDVEFTTIAPAAADTTYERRTKKGKVEVPNYTLNDNFKCGTRKVKDGDEMQANAGGKDTVEAAVHCVRAEKYNKAFDVIFLATWDDIDGCVAKQVSVDRAVKDPPVIETKYNLETSCKAYKKLDGVDITAPQSNANEITVAVPLGTAMYLECCLFIPNIQSSADNNNQFVEDGVSPVSIRMHSCTVEADIANQEFQQEVENIASDQWPEVVDSNGCGTGTSTDNGFKGYFPNTEYIWTWNQKTANAKDHLTSPTCVKTRTFPATTFARLKAAAEVDTIYHCKIDICTSTTDKNCFGNNAGGSENYPICPVKRKKREILTVGQEVPHEMSVRVRVQIPGVNGTDSAFEGCFEKKAFIGIASGMGTLLFAILIAAIFLGVKLLNAPESETSTDSMTGIQNKGYY